jgi:Fe-S-cluster-containing dehydrogenase component/DMSO reductase anchor subunit
MLDAYLRAQQDLTAVERFARSKDAPHDGRRYKDLLPATPPAAGQQYAFEVDLDACTGCKACVTACHNLNGLDEGETWRSVGLLHGGTVAAPVRQVVTTACHHCLDPACMNGCPVAAYEKDPNTGIVKHLDDQCIGCQYCTFTCPYEVPQYNEARGIVRKCDMCSDRLSAGEAPACVQGCPNGAISITVVDRRQALEDAQGDAFLPGAPSPAITVPTTVYKTERPLPRNMLPADFFRVSPAHRHAPLVVMLVLTQLSVGAFVVDALARRLALSGVRTDLWTTHSLVALAVGIAALAASLLHLGRPQYAFRALLGLRTSWMSREILAFGLFAPLAIAYAASAFLPPSLGAGLHDVLGALVALLGVVGIACSVLIYHSTRRAWWAASISGFKFFMTAVVLGVAVTVVTLAVGRATRIVETLSWTVLGASVVKGVGELASFHHLGDKRYSQLKRSALLMKGDLGSWTLARFAALGVGGVVLPSIHVHLGPSPSLAAASALLLLVGELLERTLFFAAASSPGMPGGPA